MKKTIILLLIICILLPLVISCSKKEEKETNVICTVTVYTIILNNKFSKPNKIKQIKVTKGDIIGDIGNIKVSPTLALKTFKGYYTDEYGKNKWDLYKDEVKGDMPLYLCYE